jgi:hypothetical protein
MGPSSRSPMTRSPARAVRGARGMVTVLPPLRSTTSGRWPRSGRSGFSTWPPTETAWAADHLLVHPELGLPSSAGESGPSATRPLPTETRAATEDATDGHRDRELTLSRRVYGRHARTEAPRLLPLVAPWRSRQPLPLGVGSLLEDGLDVAADALSLRPRQLADEALQVRRLH